MGAENEENTKHAFADWRAAYARITPNAADAGSNPPQGENVVFALRALLHPALRPFLFDPTLEIDETYPGLDEYARALLETPEGVAALAKLGRDDVDALYEAALVAASTGAHTPRVDADAPAAVGAIWGSLYLTARQAAVPCRVRAAWDDAARKNTTHWPAPRPLRAVSAELENAGHVALAAALAALRNSPSGLPEALRPEGIVWDLCLPGEVDALAQNAQGDSLQLPLALAFLSLLTNTPLPATWAATGALASNNRLDENGCGVAIRSVGFVDAKARALEILGPKHRFLVPAESSETGVITSSTTRVPARGLAEAFGQIVRAGETPVFAPRPLVPSPPGGTTAKAMACFVFEAGRDFQKERETLARGVLARFTDSIDATRDAWGNTVFWVRFPAAEAAIEAALAVKQNSGCFVPWPLPDGYFKRPSEQAIGTLARVGIAVDAGRDGADILWETNAKPRAEAVARAAAPGQTLVDCGEEWQTQNQTGGEPSYRLALLGRFRLLHLAPPVSLHAASMRSEPRAASDDKPGGALLDACSHNLPTETAPLIGRDAELGRLLGLLTGKFRAPLVTLTGGSGVGKTRLALEAAARTAPFFAGGLWLAPTGGAQSEDDLAARIADAMEIRLHLGTGGDNRTATPGDTLTDQVLHRVHQIGKPVLLVLDSAEAAPDAVQAFLSKVAQSGAPVTCLVTALAPLGALGEVPVPVEPLGVPLAPLSESPATDADDQRVQAAVLQSAAGAFFLSRAGRAPQTGEWKFALSVCRALRGVPLALLLVAAQTPFLSYEQIAPQFAPPVSSVANAGLIGSTAPAAAPIVVRSAFRSVYALLSPDEQTLLRRIAPLLTYDRESISGGASRAGWTREAAFAVSQMDKEDASDALTGLQNRGLLTQHSFQNRAYYTCLPVIAEWALNLLERDETEAKTALEAHARFFLRLAREKARFWDTPDETAAFDELHTQRHQLRAVAAYLQETDRPAFLRFVADTGSFLRYRGMVREWRDWPRRAVRFIELGGGALDDAPTREAALCFARLYQFCAINALDAGDVNDILAYAQSGLRIAREANHRRDSGDLLNLRAIAHGKLNQDELALADWREARALFETIGNKRGIVTVLNSEGKFWERREQWDAARACHEEQQEICRRTHDTRGLCYALGNLGCNAFFRNNAEEAQTYLNEQLTLARQLKDAEAMANALINLGDVLDSLCNAPGPAVPILALSEQIFAKLYHPTEKEAAKYLARIAPLCGESNIELWRRDFARRTLAELVATAPPLPHHLILPTDGSGKSEFFLPQRQNAGENRGVRAEDG